LVELGRCDEALPWLADAQKLADERAPKRTALYAQIAQARERCFSG